MFWIVLSSLLLSSCSYQYEHIQKPLIVCTTGMIADVAQNIAGERVQVETLMGPGIDPHVYRARAGDIDKLSYADLILYNGLHLEGKMGELFQKMKEQKPTVAVAEIIDTNQLRPSEFADLYDPHVWHDVGLWQQIIPVVEEQLCELDPKHAQEYHSNATLYKKQLQELDHWVRDAAALLSPSSRILVTAHDAFAYFGLAYGFDVVGLQGISTDSEIGIKDIQELVTFIVEHKVPTIFIESSIPFRSIQAVQQAVQAHGRDVMIGDELFSDALGDETIGGNTYIDMIRHNVNAIVAGLGERQ